MSFSNVYEIPLTEIEISELNVREGNKTKDLDQLADSIKQHGLMQPVVLVGTYGKPPYKLIAGQRRFLAHELIPKKKIRAVFAGKRLGDEKMIALSLIENLQTVDLNHADSMKAVTALYEHYGKNDRKVHEATGLSLRRVRDYISIESQASPKIKEMIRKGVSTADVKRALKAAQSNLRKAEKLLELMAQYQLTKYQKNRIVEFGEEDAELSAENILERARKPRVEEKIMVSLPEIVRAGLQRATEEMTMEAEELVFEVLEGWLNEQGFIDVE